MDLYHATLAVLLFTNAVFFWRSYRKGPVARDAPSANDEKTQSPRTEQHESIVRAFKWRFLPVYGLVSGADWLQVCCSTSAHAMTFLT